MTSEDYVPGYQARADLLSNRIENRRYFDAIQEEIACKADNMAASIRNSEEEIPAKKIKLTNEEGQEDNSDLHTFRGFQLIKVLNENAQAKTVVVHGE